MTSEIDIRSETSGDIAAITEVTAAAWSGLPAVSKAGIVVAETICFPYFLQQEN